jgi:hypothetical protein
VIQRSWFGILVLCAGVAADAQTCPFAEKIDLGWSELSPSGAWAFEVIDFDGPGPEPALLVALGSFSRAGAAGAPGLAVWNGTDWAPLPAIPGSPDPSPGFVSGLAAVDDGTGPALYVSHVYEPVLHRFDGTGWTSVPLPDYGGLLALGASALAVMDPDGGGPLPAALHAAVRYAGRIQVQRRDAVGWTPLAGFLSGELFSVRLAGYDADGAGPEPAKLHVLCNFWHDEPGLGSPFPYCRISRVDGHSMTAIDALNTQYAAVAVHDSDGPGPVLPRLYASTSSTTGPGDTLGIGAWDGVAWSNLGEGRFQVGGDGLLRLRWAGARPSVLVTDGMPSGSNHSEFAAWNGSEWAPFAGGMRGAASVMREVERDAMGNRGLAISGSLALAGRSSYTFGVWNGGAWAPFPPRPEGLVRALAVFNDGSGQRLFAAGAFSAVGTEAAFNIAKWDGETWAALPARHRAQRADPESPRVHDGGAQRWIGLGALRGRQLCCRGEGRRAPSTTLPNGTVRHGQGWARSV